jgi:hypothetical protein
MHKMPERRDQAVGQSRALDPLDHRIRPRQRERASSGN